ncbi:MAG: amidase [Rhodanobacter sp.]|nr:MAG: amidase [Rhodanobacter sp.]
MHVTSRALALAALLLLPGITAAATSSRHSYASTAELHDAILRGTLTPAALTREALQRVHALDQRGPHLNAIIELNPDAQRDADRLQPPSGARAAPGPLWGIPAVLKDNIDTADRMQTSAGSLAMVGAPARRDATLVARMRAAGMIILGKGNMSEWANYRGFHATGGWSGRGGLTHNPYVITRTACGSSSGPAVAVAAGYVPVAIGTETDGSIVCPSAINGIVGIKPTLGLVSRAGIVPVTREQDTPGPLARNVADAAALLTVIAGSDPRDPATADADRHATDYSRFVDPHGLRGKRIGVVRALTGYSPGTDKVFEQALTAMRQAGAIIVDPVTIPHLHAFDDDENLATSYEFKHDLNAYLATRSGLKVHSLADIIAFNKAHASEEMPWFGQQLMIEAEARGPLTDPAYLKARADARRLAGPEGIDAALAAHHLDALVAPTTGPAWSLDLVNGSHFPGGSAGEAAVAGYPDISVPMGFVHGLPVGISFFGAKWSEPTLISIASGFEHATHARRPPRFRTAATR